MGCASISDYQSIKQKGSLKLGTLSYPLPVKNWTHLWNPLIGQFTKTRAHEILKILELVRNSGIKYLVDRLRLVTKAEVYHKKTVVEDCVEMAIFCIDDTCNNVTVSFVIFKQCEGIWVIL